MLLHDACVVGGIYRRLCIWQKILQHLLLGKSEGGVFQTAAWSELAACVAVEISAIESQSNHHQQEPLELEADESSKKEETPEDGC